MFVTFIFVFENSQNSFSCDSPFGSFWSVKCLNFGQKPPIRTAHHTFLESRHPEVTKNPYYVLSPEGSQKKISAHGLYLIWTNFDQWKTFSENYKSMRAWLWLVYKFTELIQTQKRYPNSLDKMLILKWDPANTPQKPYKNTQFFLWTELLENLLLAKYLIISVAATLISQTAKIIFVIFNRLSVVNFLKGNLC